MEEMVFRQEAYTPNPSPSRVAMHKHSRAISKANGKPKVRIVHIFAPEIIKTDVENFRELVQRLTGKPSERDRAKNKPRRVARGVDRRRRRRRSTGHRSPPESAGTQRIAKRKRGFGTAIRSKERG
ncbi:VQ motif-containing protein 25-like [Eucalyptus grandis]|uniref:VQ motif-containing protein 25-like n=1 Tax=Eucalyptus grandis TaxID=71139 RepID=UPI00192EF3CA|nr:VQ motif-containing protein 25-like [Eucalyptus grandis]